MNTSRLLAGVAAACLVACAQTPAPPASFGAAAVATTAEAGFARALAPIAEASADAAALGRTLAALEDDFLVAYDTIDATPGGGVARNVVISLRDTPASGLRIAELRMWGPDPEAAAFDPALGVTAAADRIDARGLELFGLAEAMDDSLASFSKAIVDGVSQSAGNDADREAIAAAVAMTFDAYDVTMGRIVVEKLRLYETNATIAEGANPILAGYAPMVRWTAGYSMDTVVAEDIAIAYETMQAGAKSAASMTASFIGLAGVDRGDQDYGVYRDFAFQMTSDVPQAEGEPVVGPISLDYRYGEISLAGLRFAPVLAALSEGRLPGMAETDIAAFGTWRIRDERQSINGAEIYRADETVIDFADMYWLIPARVTMSVQNAVYDIDGVFNFVSNAVATGGAESAGAAEQMAPFREAFTRAGLERIAYSSELDWIWSPKTGDVAVGSKTRAPTLGEFNVSFSALGPDYNAISALQGPDGFDMAGLGPLFVEAGALEGMSFSMTDAGMLDKFAILAAELSKLAPADNPQAAVFAGMEPGQLRQSVGGMLLLAAPGIAQSMPAFGVHIAPMAQFLTDGGRLAIVMAPEEPLGPAGFAALDPASDPDAFARLLGLTVTHTPPGGK